MTCKPYKPQPGAVPPWQDRETLAWHLCISPETVDNWEAQGILPAGRKRGGKWMWKWAEVDARLTEGQAGGSPDKQAEDIRNGTRAALHSH